MERGSDVAVEVPLDGGGNRGNHVDDQDPNYPAMMTFRHASVGTSTLNRIASTSRLLLPFTAGELP